MKRMDFQNGRDIKQAAAAKLRTMGHKVNARCKFENVLSLVELEMGRQASEKPLSLMLDFLEERPPGRVIAANLNLMQRPPLRFDRQMQQAAERAQYQPKVPSMASSVPEYAHTERRWLR